MLELTIEQYQQAVDAQGGGKKDAKFECPRCKTHQSFNDFFQYTDLTKDQVADYFTLHCIGRFTRSRKIGCNWRLDGFFLMAEVAIVFGTGREKIMKPMFRPINLDVEKSKAQNKIVLI